MVQVKNIMLMLQSDNMPERESETAVGTVMGSLRLLFEKINTKRIPVDILNHHIFVLSTYATCADFWSEGNSAKLSNSEENLKFGYIV